MADKFHINPETGVASRCRSHSDRCPFGPADAHFSSAEGARDAYERLMEAKALPPVASRGKTLTELNQAIIATRDPAIFQAAVAQGSERTFRNLARNPHAPAEILAAAAQKASKPETRLALLTHPAFPVSEMSAQDFAQAWASDPVGWGLRGRLLEADGLRDEHLAAVGNPPDYRALKNPHNGLSKSKIVEISEKNWSTLEHGIKSGRYPLVERLPHLSMEQLRPVVSKIEDPAALDAIAQRAEGDRSGWASHVRWAVAANPHTQSATLERIVALAEDTDTLVAAYRNPRASAAVRSASVAKNATVASLDRVSKLDRAQGGQLWALIGKAGEAVGAQGRERVLYFDPNRVRELGMNSSDVDTFVRYFRGNYLYGARYDATAGRYSGWID